MESVKGKSIATDFGEILPSLRGDKVKGDKEINAGSMFMKMAGGTATIEHKRKKIKIEIDHAIPGASLILTAPNGRIFKTDPEKLIEHAIANGLLDPKLRFEEEK